MRSLTDMLGIVLIVMGILTLSYQGYHYTQPKEIARVGDVKLMEDTQKKLEFPPLLGGLSLAAGVIVLLIARMKK